MKNVVRSLGDIAKAHGAPLGAPLWTALDLQKAARDEYHRGVLSCVAYLYGVVSGTAEGRQALLDLGFEPFREDGKGPGHGRRDDQRKAGQSVCGGLRQGFNIQLSVHGDPRLSSISAPPSEIAARPRLNASLGCCRVGRFFSSVGWREAVMVISLGADDNKK